MNRYVFVRTARKFLKDEVIMSLGDISCQKEDPRRLQIAQDAYILPPDVIAHSCKPNAYIDWHSMKLKALQTIYQNDMVTYHYGTSEEDYTIGAFFCSCASPRCIGYFQGYKFMTREQRKEIERFVAPWLKRKYKKLL